MLCPQTPSIKTQSLLLLLLYFTAFIYTASNIRKEIVQILKLDLPERRFKRKKNIKYHEKNMHRDTQLELRLLWSKGD